MTNHPRLNDPARESRGLQAGLSVSAWRSQGCGSLMLKCRGGQLITPSDAQQAINRHTLQERFQALWIGVNLKKVICINLDSNRQVSVLLVYALILRLALGLESVADDKAHPSKWCIGKPT